MSDLIPETHQEGSLMAKLLKEKKIALEFVERRYDAWNDVYELNRNKVRTNRLTQRQAVNIPLMKETVKTLLSKIDDPPSVDWKELGGDNDKEIILQEMWNDDYDHLNFEGVDIQDKKTVLLYGRAFKKLNWIDKEFKINALDIFDVVVDPLVDPLDVETARFVIQQNIFRSLREILADERYTKEGKQYLKSFLATKDGIIQSSVSKEELLKKQERLKAMGVNEDEFPLFAAGDVIINLTEHYTQFWNTKKKEFEKRVIVYADNQVELLNETLKDLIGVDFYPFVSWGEDIETQDFWSDGPADLVRTPNKILNIWFSQLVENRTLKNFQMHWVAMQDGYLPQTFEPSQGRMLPSPPLREGQSIQDVIKPVEVSGLEDTLTAIDFIIKMVERGTSATAIEKGVSERKQITLGEVQTLVGKAMERTLAMAKFYRRAWEELAMKWYRIMEANASGKRTLYKVSSKGNIWKKVVYPKDWVSDLGYKAMVRSSSEQEDENTKSMQRMLFVESRHPQNQALKKIMLKRELEILNLTANEIREIEEEEKKVLELQQQIQPGEEQTIQGIDQNLRELQGLNANI